MRAFTSLAASLIIAFVGSQSIAQTPSRLGDQYENVPNGDGVPVAWLYDSEGDPLTVISNTLPTHGTLADGSAVEHRAFTYTPDSTFTLDDQFTFTAIDAEGETSIITVHLVDMWKAAKGKYVATLFDPDRRWPSGAVGLTLTTDRNFTGVIVHFGARWPIRGRFSLEGYATVEVDRIGFAPLVTSLWAVFNDAGQIEIGGHFYDDHNSEFRFASTVLEFPDDSPTAGSYTMALPAEDPAAPLGNGYVTGKVSKHGRVVFVGRVGDGQAFSFGTQIRNGDNAQFFVTAGSAPRDRLYGDVHFPGAGNDECTGKLVWNKAPRTDGYYQDGFQTEVLVTGSRLVLSPEEDTILDYSTELAGLDISFSDLAGNELLAGSLIGSTEQALTFNEDPGSPVATARAGIANRQTKPRVTFHVIRKKAIFRGTLLEPGATGKRRNFSGVFLQHQNVGTGLVRFGDRTGRVTLIPR